MINKPVIYSIYFSLLRPSLGDKFSQNYENNIHFIYRQIIRKLEFEKAGI